MRDDAADVAAGVLSDELGARGVARRQIGGKQAGGVAVTAVLIVKRVAGLIEPGRSAGHRVLRAERHEVFPCATFAVAFGHLPQLAALWRVIDRQADLEIVVGKIAGYARILLDELFLAGIDVDAPDI